MLCFKDSRRFSTYTIEVAVVQFAQVHLVIHISIIIQATLWLYLLVLELTLKLEKVKDEEIV